MRKLIIILTLTLSVTIGYFTTAIATMHPTAPAVMTYAPPQPPAIQDLPLPDYGQSAVAVDGQLIATHHTDTPAPTASTAKIILALAVRDQHPFAADTPGDVITLTQADYDRYRYQATHNGSHTKVAVGQQITLSDALAAVLIRSSNNMADSLAIWAFGSQDAYRAHATQLLQTWGLTHTTIGTDASGLDPSTTSTAADLAIIGHHLLQDPVLARIVNTAAIDIPVAGTLESTNQLLGTDGIVGIKTGSTDAAGYCLVLGADYASSRVTTVVMGADTREQSFSDSQTLLATLKSQLPITTFVTAGSEVGYYDTWWTGRIPILADQDFSALVWQPLDAPATLDSPELVPGASDLPGLLQIPSQGQIIAGSTHIASPAPPPTVWQRILHFFRP
jgi:D-alanyl-D-alanine carboxypeptidase (penicillin-binding protein 5/6)